MNARNAGYDQVRLPVVTRSAQWGESASTLCRRSEFTEDPVSDRARCVREASAPAVEVLPARRSGRTRSRAGAIL